MKLPKPNLEFSFELSQRIKNGLKRARSEGKHLGRPKKEFSWAIIERVCALLLQGYSLRQVEYLTNISRGTVWRIGRQYKGVILYAKEREIKELIALKGELNGNQKHVRPEADAVGIDRGCEEW